MTKKIKIGNRFIGGGEPVLIQSMTNTRTDDAESTIAQINALEKAECEIARVAVPDEAAALAIDKIKERINIPLVVDIHFDYNLALKCIERGADKVRINPGNIGGKDKVKAVADACKKKNIPIRIGVNGGSLEKNLLEKYGKVTPEALVESAMGHVALLEECDFNDICISIKSSSVQTTMDAYRLLSKKCDYPLHLGITEAGTPHMGIIKSAIGIGGLLTEGIGDTFRVTLTADPVEEIAVAKDILEAIGLRHERPNLVSCPTCGRTKVNLIEMTNEVEKRLQSVNKNITVAVMGCVVNGPGEASSADVGIACGDGKGILIKKGKTVGTATQDELVDRLFELIEEL